MMFDKLQNTNEALTSAYSRDQRPFMITAPATATERNQSSKSTRMPKLYNGVYSGQCGALSPPDLMEAQPKLLPKPRSNSSGSTGRNSKV